jgi:hypothetical protein
VTTSASFAVADAPLTASGINQNVSNPVSTTLARFTDADPNGTVSDYSATITWGDGSPATAGTISVSGSGFAVSGTHTYAGTGPFVFTVHVHICDIGGSCADAVSILHITYMTGRAFGLSLQLAALSSNVKIGPMPDTHQVANSLASTTHTPCSLGVTTAVLTAGALCVNVTTSTTPHSSTATATVARATIKLGSGLPVISVVGLQSTSTSSCSSESGGTTIVSLTIGGHPVTLTGSSNVTIPITGFPGAKLVVNEQQLVLGPNGDKVFTVNGLHLYVPSTLGISADVVLASATSDIHNCDPPASPLATSAASRMMNWWLAAF